MKVFVAGASGAVGLPIVKELVKHGHDVIAMTRSEAGSKQLKAFGASVRSIDAFDQTQIEEAFRSAAPHAVIDMLTFLPKNFADMPKAFQADRKLRIEGGGNVFQAALANGVQRYFQQSCGFWIKPGGGERLGTENDGFEWDATPNIAGGSEMYRQLEQRVFSDSRMKGTALRFGFFYGPGTWYTADGSAGEMVRGQHLPIVGAGSAVNSFVHVEDAAQAAVAALTAEPGVYNIVDDHPVPVATWLPAFAAYVGAPPPPHVSEEVGGATAGPDVVFYHNKLSGASNQKAKKVLRFAPRPLEWLQRGL